MKTIDNEEVTFEGIDDHFYKFDAPEVLGVRGRKRRTPASETGRRRDLRLFSWTEGRVYALRGEKVNPSFQERRMRTLGRRGGGTGESVAEVGFDRFLRPEVHAERGQLSP